MLDHQALCWQFQADAMPPAQRRHIQTCYMICLWMHSTQKLSHAFMRASKPAAIATDCYPKTQYGSEAFTEPSSTTSRVRDVHAPSNQIGRHGCSLQWATRVQAAMDYKGVGCSGEPMCC